jgi:hypothetical protein
MVITPEEAAAAGPPSVQLRVNSDPPGATVLIRGKLMGVTPASFEWRDPQAKPGATLVLQLKRDGYQTYTLKHPIDARELELAATLEPVPAPAPVQLQPPAEAEDDLRALEERARAREAPSTPEVIKITPSAPGSELPATDEQTQ